jgi:Mce-associated membrane protein
MANTIIRAEHEEVEADHATSPSDTDPARSASDTEAVEHESDESQDADRVRQKKSRRLQLSFSIRGLVLGVSLTVLIGAAATFAWLYLGAQRNIHALHQQAGDNTKAEQVALDYAVNAAGMNFKDLGTWKSKLVAGTSPELNKKLTDAATSMEQILVPLEWTSTARPLAAKVRSETNGVYVVDSFVSVLTKTSQSQEPLQSTATYSVTIDTGNGWQITDVGGIGAAVDGK